MKPNEIYHGDCRVLLSEMDPESVQVVVTSPPYYPALRDYGVEPSVWSKDPACDTCDHEWIDAETKSRNNRLHVGGNLGADRVGGGRWLAEHRRGMNHSAVVAYGNQNLRVRQGRGLGRGQFCRFCSAWRGVLGAEPDPGLYVEHLVQIFRHVWRVLRADGLVFLNIGDAHAGSGRGGNPLARAGVKQDTNRGSLDQIARRVPPGAKAKDLLLVPDLLALALREDGWYFRQKILWSKPNPMPESTQTRPTTAHEFIFMLAKSGRAQFWSHRHIQGSRTKPDPDYVWIDWKNDQKQHSVEPRDNWREETYEVDGDQKRRWSRKNLWVGHDYYYDPVAIQEPAKYSGDPRGGRPCSRRGSDMKQISDRTVTGAYRNKRSVWSIVTEPYKGDFFAAYPKALVEPCILAGSSHRACPVCGAAWFRCATRRSYITRPTTGRASQKHKRNPGNAKGLERVGGHAAAHTVTIGWLPTCDCKGNDGSGQCLILDPFMGSGTTAVVARNLGRYFLGFEANAEYVELARKRIEQESAQTIMFFD